MQATFMPVSPFRGTLASVVLKASFLLICLAPFSTAQAEEPGPPVDVEFYFSNTDPRLAETEKILAEVVKKLPQIKIERISIDDKKGYKRLAKQEKELDIKTTGDRTLIFGPHVLISKGEVRDIETYFGPMIERVIKQSKGDSGHKDRLKPDVPAYAKEIFGKDATAAAKAGTQFESIIYYNVTNDGKHVGWVADAYDPIGCPICSGTQFMLSADQKGTILDVRPVREIERIGSKLPDAETEKFIKQFKGKTPANEPLKVDGISRATKTVHAYQTAINEILEELKKRTKE